MHLQLQCVFNNNALTVTVCFQLQYIFSYHIFSIMIYSQSLYEFNHQVFLTHNMLSMHPNEYQIYKLTIIIIHFIINLYQRKTIDIQIKNSITNRSDGYFECMIYSLLHRYFLKDMQSLIFIFFKYFQRTQ